jgi:Na+-translocating ferredoxin:NAD+ oxidoreductase RnfD subunit
MKAVLLLLVLCAFAISAHGFPWNLPLGILCAVLVGREMDR